MSVVAEYDRFCESIHSEAADDLCGICGPECECAGPSPTFIATELVEKVRAASPLTRLTPAVSYEADTEVVDAEKAVIAAAKKWQETNYCGPVAEGNLADAIDHLGDVEYAAKKPLSKRIPADPRMAAAADDIASTILAVLRAHGYAIVREADTQSYDEKRQREFARECGRNAMAVLAMTEAA